MQKQLVFIYLNLTKNKTENKKMREEFKTYMKEFNFKVKREFTDDPSTDERGLIELMNYSGIEKDVTKVIAYSRNNMSQDDIFVMWIEKELMKNGSVIKYLNEKTLRNPELELLREKVIGAFARYEKEKLPNKLAAHREYKIFETGVKASGNCPLGYKYEGKTSKEKRVVVVDKEAQMVNEIFENYIDFKSLGKLKSFLDEKRYRTRRGKKFSRQALYNILTNKFYIGILSYNQYKYINVGGQKKKKPILIEERRVDGKHKKIISIVMFEKAGKILAENNKHKND